MIANAAASAVSAAETEAYISLLDDTRGLGDGANFFRDTRDRHAWLNPYNTMAGSGGLIGPPTDPIRFAQMILNAGQLDGVRVLSPESVALMQQVQLSTSGEPPAFGLGWHVVDEGKYPYIERDGGGAGIAAKVRLYVDEGFDRNEVADAAANVVLSMLGE
jgi:CubicO group peptidase (beta-lactamase class C family)